MKSFAIACSTIALGAQAVRLDAMAEAEVEAGCPIKAGTKIGEYTIGGAIGSQKFKMDKAHIDMEVNAIFGAATTIPAATVKKHLGADSLKLFGLKADGALTKKMAANAMKSCKVAHGDSGFVEPAAAKLAEVEAEVEATKCPVDVGTSFGGFTVGTAVGKQLSAEHVAWEVNQIFDHFKVKGNSIDAAKLPAEAQKVFNLKKGDKLTKKMAADAMILCKVAHSEPPAAAKLAEVEAEVEAGCPVDVGTSFEGFTVGTAVGKQLSKEVVTKEVNQIFDHFKVKGNSIPAANLPADVLGVFNLKKDGALTKKMAIDAFILCKIAHA